MAISENGVSFFGSGGHTHNGVNSSIIDVGSYSLFDFSLGYKGSQSRINAQGVNQGAMEDWIVRIVNSKVLQPAGLTLDPNSLNGKSIRSNTITARELQANTITADEIASNTITANELTANLVLVNNIIRSNVYTPGSTGWQISSDGTAEFSGVTVRGNITGSNITGSTLTTDNGSRGVTIYDGYIKGLYSVGIQFRDSSDSSSYTYIDGGIISTDSVLVSDGTNDIDINPVNPHIIDTTLISTSASDSAIRTQRSGSTNMSRHITFAKSDTTYVGSIRYKNGDNNTMVFEGDITGTSDIRLKENIEPLLDSLSIVKGINPVKFNFIRSPEIVENGFIAQELYDVYPMAVEMGGDNPATQPWSVMSARLIPVLTGAIKELSSKVDELESRLQGLEGV